MDWARALLLAGFHVARLDMVRCLRSRTTVAGMPGSAEASSASRRRGATVRRRVNSRVDDTTARPTDTCTPSSSVYITGTTTSVSTVDEITPPSTVAARGARRSAPSPSWNAVGVSDAAMVRLVIRMARNRAGPASTSAARIGIPRARL